MSGDMTRIDHEAWAGLFKRTASEPG